MRHPRQRLQVSTFPFLAVLLCAMGSLILLLLVIDRRAKVVARAKAMRAMEQALVHAASQEDGAAAANRAEWERRRQMLHEQLLQRDQQIVGELQTVQSKAAAATASVQDERARGRELQEQLQAQRADVARLEDGLATRRATEMKTAPDADAARAELGRLSADLERMEGMLAGLKAARRRQQQMYSLVPYHGKRGDNRKPLYIECTADQLIFHPDHLALQGVTLTPSVICGEIERRLARLRADRKHAADPPKSQGLIPSPDAVLEKPEENAYLLMLIRPDGIPTYYRTLAALKGLRVDFGYEFIDQDWILDFSEDHDAPKQQPWMVAEQTKVKQPAVPLVKDIRGAGPLPTGRPQTAYKGLLSGATVPKQPVGILASGKAESGNTPLGSSGIAGRQESNLGAVTPMSPPAHVEVIDDQDGVGKTISGMGDTTKGPSFAEGLMGGSRSSAARGGSPEGNPMMDRDHAEGHTASPLGSGPATEGPDVGPSLASGPGATNDLPSGGQATQGNEPGQAHVAGTPGNPGHEGIETPPSILPRFAPHGGRAASTPGIDEGPPNEGAQRDGPAQAPSDSGESTRGIAGDPLNHLAGPNQLPKTIRAVPLRPGLLNGNRDWIISIECTADALVLYPSGHRIATDDFLKAENGRTLLLHTIQGLIARRQATVRPGEPPYRPMIRFRVRPDGLRSYYLAYPVLEALHVPMSRENLDPEEEKAARRGR